MNILQKLKETVSSVMPIMAIVLLLGVTIAPLGWALIARFLVGGVLVIFGLTVFLLGIDVGIIPIGERSGAALAAKRNLPLLLIVAFAVGFIVTVAEPDVQVLANQVKGISPSVSKWGLILMIAAGVGLFVSLGMLRTVLSFPLNILLLISYAVVFVLAAVTPAEFQGVAFDSGGATTGPMTVPFIMHWVLAWRLSVPKQMHRARLPTMTVLVLRALHLSGRLPPCVCMALFLPILPQKPM